MLRIHRASASDLDKTYNSAPKVEGILRSCLKLFHLSNETSAQTSRMIYLSTAAIIYPACENLSDALAHAASDAAKKQRFSDLILLILTFKSANSWTRLTNLLTSTRSLTTDFETLCYNKEQLAAKSGLVPDTNQLIAPRTARICFFSSSVVSSFVSRFRFWSMSSPVSFFAYSIWEITMSPFPFCSTHLPRKSPFPWCQCLKGYNFFNGSAIISTNSWFPPKHMSLICKANTPMIFLGFLWE